jgi:REP element-mobilizing transposase RayT
MGVRRRRSNAEQLTLFCHGGRRPGAGRNPEGPRPCVSRRSRPALALRFPVLVTVRLRDGLPSLRHAAELRSLHAAFLAGSRRPHFRIVHTSVQSNHVHLIVEAHGKQSLASGTGGLLIRIARGLNRLWRRHGRVFSDRYHARILRTPSEVRNALVYVLQNARKHGWDGLGPDPCSSGPWFDGWRDVPDAARNALRSQTASPFAQPRTWLLRVGWQRLGRIGIEERPAPLRRRRPSRPS